MRYRTLEERFWKQVKKTQTCWLFPATQNQGYGQIQKSGDSSSSLAHRVSWELHFGPIPKGQCVLHRCDVRNCVRPDHLFLGTKTDNHNDMVAKGRSNSGEKNRANKLTLKQVQKIRELLATPGLRQREIAERFGITKSNVSAIATGRSWNAPHLTNIG